VGHARGLRRRPRHDAEAARRELAPAAGKRSVACRTSLRGSVKPMPQDFPAELRQRLPARAQSVPQARQAVAEFATARGAANGNLYAIKLAVSEAVTNAVVHASRGSGDADVLALEADVCDGMLRVSVSDQGFGMRPRVDSPGAGLGMGIIATLTEHVEITDTNPGLRLTMTFAIS
jgi:serine/threonine-protein kinase RsbW